LHSTLLKDIFSTPESSIDKPPIDKT